MGRIAARQFMGALRACLDARQTARNGKIDGLVITNLEMQERVDNAPLLLQKDAKANAQNQIAHVVENTLDELNVNLGMY